jgi:hypothetical protein
MMFRSLSDAEITDNDFLVARIEAASQAFSAA